MACIAALDSISPDHECMHSYIATYRFSLHTTSLQLESLNDRTMHACTDSHSYIASNVRIWLISDSVMANFIIKLAINYI